MSATDWPLGVYHLGSSDTFTDAEAENERRNQRSRLRRAVMHRTGRLSTPRAQRVRRSRGARIFVVMVAVFLGAALVRLQVVQGDKYTLVSKTNRLRELPIPAPRGTIYDRHGRVVAENVPGFRIQIMPGTRES
jgi:hypothetical protein